MSALSLTAAAEAPSLQEGLSPRPGSSRAKFEGQPGWARSGADDAAGHKAYYINLEAMPRKGDKVERLPGLSGKDTIIGVGELLLLAMGGCRGFENRYALGVWTFEHALNPPRSVDSRFRGDRIGCIRDCNVGAGKRRRRLRA